MAVGVQRDPQYTASRKKEPQPFYTIVRGSLFKIRQVIIRFIARKPSLDDLARKSAVDVLTAPVKKDKGPHNTLQGRT